MVRLIEGLGTPESTWRAWSGLATLDTVELHPPPARAVVVAPHPDDEASHPHSPTHTPMALARIRRAEQRQALARLVPWRAARRVPLPVVARLTRDYEVAML
ncbi:MAG: hypothetical protein ACRDRS_25195 [Pseudonocardiaceae bacterium]